MQRHVIFSLLIAGLCLVVGARAEPQRGGYDPLKAFAPFAMPEPANAYRAADGAPGPLYWQNSADYEIHARLDVAARTLAADEVITYTNNSPAALSYLWLQLDQNIYQSASRAGFVGGRARTQFTRGYDIASVEIDAGGRATKADFVISDTRMQIRLGAPLKGGGGKLRLRISYRFTVPGLFGGRTAVGETRNGDIYDIAQWYPRMAVYDDMRGWDTLPYIGSEFYLEYGHFDYYVTLPWDMLVAGSGELVNPQDVLTPTQRARLAAARLSDKTVTIRGAAEIADPASRPKQAGDLTWHFRMDKSRDVAFSASRAFIWDAARIQLPDGGASLAMSFYPAESAGADGWDRSTEYLKHAVEDFSRRWTPYPYPAAINVAGKVGGMEYPGLLFDSMDSKGKGLFWITAHEIGHTWFPMVVGANERRHAWMDEGFNTFIDVYESDTFENGVYGPKRDSEYAQGGGNPADEIVALMTDANAPPILTSPDAIGAKYGHPVSYFKTALGLVLLREQIVGPDRFDYAFRKFIRDWSYRHPSPSDFFRAMNSAAGEDLSWYWRGWFETTWTLDFAAQGVDYVNGDPRQGANVTVAALNPLIMPAVVEIAYQGGERRRVTLPAETWIQRGVTTIHVDGDKRIVSVTIDPDHALPDVNRANNVFSPAAPGAH